VNEAFAIGPRHEEERWTWRARRGDVRVLFTGRGPADERAAILARHAPSAPPLAWARQVHSARVLTATAGDCGEGDALLGRGSDLALSVVTADCVPVVLAGPEGLAAVHAGWRGIAAGIVAATLAAATERPSDWCAWVGPAIGACCYEVGDDVAESVVAASGESVRVAGANGRPHLDLPGAARLQLAAAGVREIYVLPRCTRCDEERLWSYRRLGKGAGRNLAFIWREPGAAS